jgi:hypothetical protein
LGEAPIGRIGKDDGRAVDAERRHPKVGIISADEAARDLSGLGGALIQGTIVTVLTISPCGAIRLFSYPVLGW